MGGSAYSPAPKASGCPKERSTFLVYVEEPLEKRLPFLVAVDFIKHEHFAAVSAFVERKGLPNRLCALENQQTRLLLLLVQIV